MVACSYKVPCPLPRNYCFSFNSRRHKLLPSTRFASRKPFNPSIFCLRIGVENIAEIAQNKVLVAAAISGAIGQLSKPFSSSLLYGKAVDFKAAVSPGGFPSTHSSGVVAAATSLALERGFSDSIFGMAVVFAVLVMYDAQGIRREVGNHAKVLNRRLLEAPQTPIPRKEKDNGDLINSKPGKSSIKSESLAPLMSSSENGSPSISNPEETSAPFRSKNTTARSSTMLSMSLTAASEESSAKASNSYIPLKESIGHTEVEVVAGALLGFLVSLAVHSLL
ncbi:uncharacterized protein LOC122653223 [Telopea speciosissima]|uniref:uncharacterized protein LOC122653223 n=1 Tax=Telopea speciosissima TaxID=54955 RepID=UPI001CC44E75|nr:uncharacterized protein LOC122653223 [Telopea speciosissima]XP_043703110.1 uncharacterized protein LOC122653223 [Telopea speciosissima]